MDNDKIATVILLTLAGEVSSIVSTRIQTGPAFPNMSWAHNLILLIVSTSILIGMSTVNMKFPTTNKKRI